MEHPPSITRIRVGLIIWVCSFLPFPSISLHILHNQGKLLGTQASTRYLAICYSVQFAIGFIGLIIAGKEAAGLIKTTGWRSLPRTLWRVVIHGQLPDLSRPEAK